MTLKKLLLVASAHAAACAFAQAPLGSVVNVQGVVTATQGATGMTVAPGHAVQNGMRFVTTSNGSVTLRLNSGCTVKVPAGHGLTVLQSMTCQELVSAVQPVMPVAANSLPPVSTGLVNGIAAGGAALIAIQGFRVVVDNDDESLSAR